MPRDSDVVNVSSPHWALMGEDEFDLAARGLLPIGGAAGFCPAQFTGCERTNGGTVGTRFDGSVSQFIFGDIHISIGIGEKPGNSIQTFYISEMLPNSGHGPQIGPLLVYPKQN